jgi:hypothetical protein
MVNFLAIPYASGREAMNTINVIAPYNISAWVFDDQRVGLSQEPFVSGTDAMIDRVVADIPNGGRLKGPAPLLADLFRPRGCYKGGPLPAPPRQKASARRHDQAGHG